MRVLGFSRNKTNLIKNLKTRPKNELYAMAPLQITNTINELSFETNFNLLAISKAKYGSNNL